MQRQVRIKKELAIEAKSPTPGISLFLEDEDAIEVLDGLITGPEDSPFSGGCFKVKITLPERYFDLTITCFSHSIFPVKRLIAYFAFIFRYPFEPPQGILQK